MRVMLAASALMLALVAPAESAAERVWGFVKSDDDVRLFYGVPDSGDVTLVFACVAKRKRIEIINTVLPHKPRIGQAVKTTLRNGAISAVNRGKLGHSESEGFYVAASTAAYPAVLDVLKSGTSLTIGIPGRQERVPLRGIANPLATFETACFGQRERSP
jgi:hypothetical protein